MPSNDRHINFALMRDRIVGNRQGKEYWRSLDELADSPEFQEFVSREYPQHAEEWDDPVGRRNFIKLMGASLALAGLSSCVYQPPEKIVPYVKQPEEEVPGKALFFATAMSIGGVATGLLVRSNEGRPTKIEGNPDHPSSMGATDLFSQASILDLYDPDRAQTVTFREEIRPWSSFLGSLRGVLDKQKATRGAGLRILTETISSPSLASQLQALLALYPSAKWHQYEPAARNNILAGAMLAFGTPVNTIYHFDVADRVFSIDSDFLSCGPANLRYTRDFISRRRLPESEINMNRLYAIECSPTNTGAKADHRLAVRPSEIEAFVRAVAASLSASLGGGTLTSTPSSQPYTSHSSWISALAKDLSAHRGTSIVIAGDEQPPVVHALAHALNAALGNAGRTITYTETIEANPVDHVQSLRDLNGDLDTGNIELLVILGGNPVYAAPADFQFGESLRKAKLAVHLSSHNNETSELCHWHIPQTHYLESWGDARAFDGTVSIVQPLTTPLFQGRSDHEILAALMDQADTNPYEIVRGYWMAQKLGGASSPMPTPAAAAAPSGSPISGSSASNDSFEQTWRKAVHDGFIPNTALPLKNVSLKQGWDTASQSPPAQSTTNDSRLEILFRTDPTIYDGRFANNGWLQELPKPLTKLTWDNAAMVSLNTAKALGLNQGGNPDTQEQGDRTDYRGKAWNVDTVDLTFQGRTLRGVPAWILPGQPDGVVTLTLGYGRRRAGRVGTSTPSKPVGFNAYSIRPSDALWAGTDLHLKKTGGLYTLATTQIHYTMEGRDIVRSHSLADYLKDRGAGGENNKPIGRDESFYPPYDYKNQGNGYAWGMAIDASTCVGCNACIMACQSENNIPIVGKEQVLRSREMHWLRVDAYFKGDPEDPEETHFMPVPCMHCENAPCEPVCPVHATVHSAEGTNDMVYNRCVGTRYCSNNCPYKVRHFNFLLYQDWDTPTYQLMRNPEVSVRSRGVMEKCTYCIQRIQAGKIESEKDGRQLSDGEIVTACQAVCPAEAIVFGDVNDPNSKVSKLKAQERNYSLLGELNTRPRTTYLSSIRNPNPEISGKG